MMRRTTVAATPATALTPARCVRPADRVLLLTPAGIGGGTAIASRSSRRGLAA
jgi:hypothetical protein